MEKERQTGKRMGWGIERKMFFFWNCYFLDKTVCRNQKALSIISTVSDNILSL
jgi:hypothetical protein